MKDLADNIVFYQHEFMAVSETRIGFGYRKLLVEAFSKVFGRCERLLPFLACWLLELSVAFKPDLI